MPSIPDDLAAFLVEAKRRTYAGLDDDATVATPLLAGSKQLEHRAPPYAYRDIYFGMGFFVGQETVSRDDRIIWSMSYSGGVRAEIMDRDTFLAIYKFLRQALLAVSAEEPYRGPRRFEQAGMIYRNEAEGALDRFHGLRRLRGMTARHFTNCGIVEACCNRLGFCSPDEQSDIRVLRMNAYRFAHAGYIPASGTRATMTDEPDAHTRSPFSAIRAIDYTVIFVRDMTAMRRFYEDVLALTLLRELSPNWIEYGIGPNTLALAKPGRTAADAPTPEGSASLQLAFKVSAPEVDQCADELVRQGVALLSPPTDQPFGHRTLFFRDPDGNLLEIYAEI